MSECLVCGRYAGFLKAICKEHGPQGVTRWALEIFEVVVWTLWLAVVLGTWLVKP